jgi:hypothetical protein
MLQNRVDPFGKIILTDARGSFMGNRGVIHNEDRQITHAFKHKQWIICVLKFKDRKRSVMTPGRWTELFFLDEATAFAAGHRPCFECRKEDAKQFKSCWIQGNASHKFTMTTSIKAIDEVLHRERIDSNKTKVTHQRLSSELPDGTFVINDDDAFLLNNGRLHRWTPFGYDNSRVLSEDSILTVLTPQSVVNAFSAGYRPQLSKLS